MRMLSYLSLPCPCMRRLRKTSAMRVVVGHHRAAVAVAAERLGRKEAGRGGMAEGAEPAVVECRAECLRGIVENKQAFRFGSGGDRSMVRRQAEQIDRDDRLRREPCAFCRRNSACDSVRVDIEGSGVDIDKNRRRADQRRHFGGRAKRE